MAGPAERAGPAGRRRPLAQSPPGRRALGDDPLCEQREDGLTSSAALKGGDSSRSAGLRCRFAVHRRARLRKKAPRAATACPAAVPPADSLAIAADARTLPQHTDKTE